VWYCYAVSRPTLGELRAAGWTPRELAIPERGPPLLTRRTALLLAAPFSLWVAGVAAGASAQAAAEAGAVFVLTVAGFLALMVVPQRLTFGRFSLVGLHEQLHALPLRAVGAEPSRVSVRVRNPFGGSCVAEDFLLRPAEYVCMALAPTFVLGVPAMVAAVAAFAVDWPGIPGFVVRNLAVAMVVWHVGACRYDARCLRHVLRAGKDVYADVRLEGGALTVRAWTAVGAGPPRGSRRV
jgi:hypothetical protein